MPDPTSSTNSPDSLGEQMRSIASQDSLAQTVIIGQENTSSPLTKTYSRELNVGTIIQNYEIIEILGAGGFGVTYLAQDTFLGRYVVLKENFPSHCAHRDPLSGRIVPNNKFDVPHYNWALKSFINEARTLAGLSHPNIVRILSIFESNDTAYFAMDYIEGLSLDYLADKKKLSGQSYTESELTKILSDILSALSYIHAKGIIHKDIKPANILVNRPGQIHLIDFGAAREVAGKHTTTVTASHGFSSPEQSLGMSNLGAWTDLYSLGATMFLLLTGRAPHRAESRIMKDEEILLSSNAELKKHYSQAFLKSIDKALSPKVEKRFQTAEEWLAVLPSTTGASIVISAEEMEHAGFHIRKGTQSRHRRRYNATGISSSINRQPVKAKKNQLGYTICVILALLIPIVGLYFFTDNSVYTKQKTSPTTTSIIEKEQINLNKIPIGDFHYNEDIPTKTVDNDSYVFSFSDDYIVESEPITPETKQVALASLSLRKGHMNNTVDTTTKSEYLSLEIYNEQGECIAKSHNKVPVNVILEKAIFTYNFPKLPTIDCSKNYVFKFINAEGVAQKVKLDSIHNNLKGASKDLFVPYAQYICAPIQKDTSLLKTPAAEEILLNLQALNSDGKINLDSIPQTAESLPIIEALAEKGNAWAMYVLSNMYEKGLGTQASAEMAYLWRYRAAKFGCLDAQSIISAMHSIVRQHYPKTAALPKGVIHEPNLAFKFARAAAQQRNPASIFLLGIDYAQGWGIPQSATMAERTLKLAGQYSADFITSHINPSSHYLSYWEPYYMTPYKQIPIVCSLKGVDLTRFKGIKIISISNNIVSTFSNIKLIYQNKVIAESLESYNTEASTPLDPILLPIPPEYQRVDPASIELHMDAKSRGLSYGIIELVE